jgi:hypothetical protein
MELQFYVSFSFQLSIFDCIINSKSGDAVNIQFIEISGIQNPQWQSLRARSTSLLFLFVFATDLTEFLLKSECVLPIWKCK